MKMKFKKWNGQVEKMGEYSNGRIALELIDKNGDITVNMPDEVLKEGEIIVKDYSENEGMYNALFEAGVVGPVKRRAESGYITAPIVDLLVKF